MKGIDAIKTYFVETKTDNIKKAGTMALTAKDAFEAMMEGAALMLDFVGQVEYTYTTNSGNKVHVLMDSP